MNEKFAWYLSRSSGWTAFVLIACTVLWGVLGITRIVERRGLPRWLLHLHRHLAFLSVVFTAIHLLALVADDYLHIAWREIFVPMALDQYRPGAVTWGVVALYLLVAVQVSSWLRDLIPRRWWRGIHFLSYPAFWMITVHGLQAGSDAGRPVVRWGVVVLVGLVAFVTFVRLFTVGPRRRRSDGAHGMAGPARSVDTLAPDETQVPPTHDHQAGGADVLDAPAGGVRAG